MSEEKKWPPRVWLDEHFFSRPSGDWIDENYYRHNVEYLSLAEHESLMESKDRRWVDRYNADLAELSEEKTKRIKLEAEIQRLKDLCVKHIDEKTALKFEVIPLKEEIEWRKRRGTVLETAHINCDDTIVKLRNESGRLADCLHDLLKTQEAVVKEKDAEISSLRSECERQKSKCTRSLHICGCDTFSATIAPYEG